MSVYTCPFFKLKILTSLAIYMKIKLLRNEKRNPTPINSYSES
jgi:hypothetical protein